MEKTLVTQCVLKPRVLSFQSLYRGVCVKCLAEINKKHPDAGVVTFKMYED